MSVRGALLLAAIGALLLAMWPAAAQDQLAQTSTYRLGDGDRDRDRDRGWDRDGRPDRPYFTPTPMPFQGSETRRWQRKLEEIWGGLPAGRGPRHQGPIFYYPYPGPGYTYRPYSTCDRLGCYRRWQWERGYRGGHTWHDWYGYGPER